MTDRESQFVTRAGLKLSAALEHFGVDPGDMVCVDLGSNVGGFTDCLLERSAQKVYAVDTGYGVLDYRLRKDSRVVVMERTNALFVRLPELCDLAVIDLGWTVQSKILPRARELIKPTGKIITLVKPHYEAPKNLLKAGLLTPDQSEQVFVGVLESISSLKLRVLNHMPSPITGSGGNAEYLVLLERI
jgi:23S rRNA (cytidine1920-2'-O)/16S rRNA (cytidine1409-2'-O)-methyltransferase